MPSPSWISKRAAFIRSSVPAKEYKPHPGAILRDDLIGLASQKRGEGTQYLQELKKNAEMQKRTTMRLENRSKAGATFSPVRAKGEGGLLDGDMLKDLATGNLKAQRQSRVDKAMMLTQYYSNKKSLGAPI